MAVKPGTVPQIWAPNAVWVTGPFIGSPTKTNPAASAQDGHRAGSNFPTAAEHENYQHHWLTRWVVDWLSQGSSAGAADAHVVETNAGGRAGLYGLDVDNGLDAIAATFSGQNVNFPTVYGICNTPSGVVFQADFGANGVGYAANLSAGTGVGFLGSIFAGAAAGARAFAVNMVGAGNSTFGYRGTADAASEGDLVRLDHQGTGRAITIQHFGTPPGAILSVFGFGPGNTPAVRAKGTGTAYTLHAESSNTPGGGGVFGDTLNQTGHAVHGRTFSTATDVAAAVRAEGRGAATGLAATGVNGDALTAFASNVANVAIRLLGKATDPTSTFGGRMDFNTTTGTWVISDQDASTYRDLHASRGGLAIGTSSGGALVTNNNAAAYVTAGTLALTGQSTPRRAGVRLTLRFSCEARSLVAATNTVDVRITDTTAGVTVVERSGVGALSNDGYFLSAATTSWQRNISLDVPYTVPAAGDRTFIAEVKPSTANGIQVRDCRLEPYGSYT